MKAVIITQPGGPEVLKIQEIETPRPQGQQILVRVKASALNRADILQREGRYPAPAGSPQNIPGLEFAGEVATLGPQAARWREGQRVFGITAGGAHAEYVLVDERELAEIPDNLSWPQAAAVPEAFITAQDAMWKQAELRAGESVLIHAAGSGVGLAAAQLARIKGAVPYGTSRTEDKLDRARKYGLQDGVVLTGSLNGLLERTQQWTEGRGFDVIIDLVGGAYVSASVEALALKGRLMLIGTVAGGKAEINISRILGKRLRMTGTVLRSRSLEEKIAVTQAFLAEVVPLFAAGKFRPVIDREFPLEEIQAAHRRMESNHSFGKIVITVNV